jgi:ribosomal protein S18 acetylase RimI-like enzyme
MVSADRVSVNKVSVNKVSVNKVSVNKIQLEHTYQQCKTIIDSEVKYKLMGWIYRVLLDKSMQDGLFFCEKDDQQIIGFALCRKLTRKGIISIDKIGVHPQYRRQGIGQVLINRVKQLGLPVKLDVTANNQTAIRFYLKNGFQITGTKVLGQQTQVLTMTLANSPQ